MPWKQEQITAKRAKLDKEAGRVKARIGARTVAIVAFFDDGSPSLMLLEGGSAPVPAEQLYANLAQIYAANRTKLEQEGKDQPAPTNNEPPGVQ